MKILTWNINGIRTKSSLQEEIQSLDADIICFQETKVTRDMLEEPTAIIEGYSSYFSFSRKRAGYSGVATYCRDTCTPVRAEEGLSGLLALHKQGDVGCYGNTGFFEKSELQDLDAEGRAVITQHTVRTSANEVRDVAVINVYVPRVDSEREDRREFKLHFLTLLQSRAEALLQQGSHVLIVGDLNISHRELDHCDPDSQEFGLRKDRQWLDSLLGGGGEDKCNESREEEELGVSSGETRGGGGFVDTFRYFHPNQQHAFTCWCTLTSSRLTNYGTRLDYILADTALVKLSLVSCEHLTDVQGSDHCPVKAELTLTPLPADKEPPFCTKFLPEFSGKQQKLSSFFRRKETIKNIPHVEDGEQENSKASQVKDCQEHSQLNNSQLPDKKRPAAINHSQVHTAKKPKLSSWGSQNGKQGNLMNFFRNTSKKSIPSETNGENSNISCNIKAKSEQEKCVEGSNVVDKVVNDKMSSEKLTSDKVTTSDKAGSASSTWRGLLGGLGKPPLCQGHKEPCVLRMVKKDGPNKFRQFYVCARAEGHKSNPEARCNHFEWLEKKKVKK